MLIELHTQAVGRWYWVTYPVAGGIGVRLVVTRMDPQNIAVDYVGCTVYGVCDYTSASDQRFGRSGSTRVWSARKIGLGRGHGNIAEFGDLRDAKEWLLTTVARVLRQSQLLPPQYASSFLSNCTYEPLL